ncbi:hypothetical protein [Microbispora amethystogenes]|uniref:N-acetyltransferase domain-containing protein n=1 Tax=Microbispora amethystogenes TaxID=1427754 RepID=A0ABQ4FIT0_9ACTN|nr:hypothetical protein [Microbispora amethystogenes]GIH34668.1 hypothetical protein Mam01_48320 [Microbispora amethystogenes]
MLGEILETGRGSTTTAVLDDVLRRSQDWFARRRLTLRYDEDVSGWAGHMRTADRSEGTNPTFDPEHSPVSAANSYWLDVRDRDGRTVACIAVRVIHTADFARHISSMRLWYDPVPAELEGRLDLVLPPETPVISGAVAHYGGHWVHPDWRRNGLPGVLLPLAKILTAELFGSDWDTGIVLLDSARKRSLLAAYGFARTEICYSGFFPPRNRDETFFLVYSTREETLRALPAAISGLREEAQAGGVRRPAG